MSIVMRHSRNELRKHRRQGNPRGCGRRGWRRRGSGAGRRGSCCVWPWEWHSGVRESYAAAYPLAEGFDRRRSTDATGPPLEHRLHRISAGWLAVERLVFHSLREWREGTRGASASHWRPSPGGPFSPRVGREKGERLRAGRRLLPRGREEGEWIVAMLPTSRSHHGGMTRRARIPGELRGTSVHSRPAPHPATLSPREYAGRRETERAWGVAEKGGRVRGRPGCGMAGVRL